MRMRLISLLAFVVFFLSGCGVQPTPPAVTDAASPAAGTEFSDPFAYCTAAQMAEFLLELYDGDKTVGEMDFATFSIKLSDAKHPHFA